MEVILSPLSSVLMLLGSLFILLAAIGLVRFPDTLIRMAAVSKASTLGLLLLLTGVAIQQTELETILLIVFMMAFTLLTTPVASHLIGRAAYRSGVPLFKNTHRNDWPEGRKTSNQKNEEI